MSEVIMFPQRVKVEPQPEVIDGMTEHLFGYRKDGILWGISIWAKDEADARDRLRLASEGDFTGICVVRIDA